MDINVQEVMGAQAEKPAMERPTFIMPQGASVEDAQERMNIIMDVMDQLMVRINATNTGCTSAAWQGAYADLTMALEKCVKVEKEIILEA